jgi:hypothetical protein
LPIVVGDVTRGGSQLWTKHLPRLETVTLNAWDIPLFEPPDEVLDFCIRHIQTGKTPIYDFDYRDRGLVRVRFGVADDAVRRKRLTATTLTAEPECLADLVDTHFEHLESSLKSLTFDVFDPFDGLEALDRLYNHIKDLINYRNGVSVFQLDQLNVNIGPDHPDIWQLIKSEHVTNVIKYFHAVCGPSITSWIGCTPPVPIPAEELAAAFSRHYKKLRNITIDEHIFTGGKGAEDYALALARQCAELREVTVRPSISAGPSNPGTDSDTGGFEPKSAEQLNYEGVIMHFHIERGNNSIPFIERCIREMETEGERMLRSP